MEFENTPSKNKSKDFMGFFRYVFDFNNDNKNDMLNMVQYTLLTIVPILLVLKTTRTYVPEVDEHKGSPELLAESAFQIVFIILSFWFIHRVIAYIPTYSGVPYRDFNETCFILPFIFILLTLQTKLGDKLRILSDRLLKLWNGEKSLREGNTNMNNSNGAGNTHQPSQADALEMSLGLAQPNIGLPHPQMTSVKSQSNDFRLQTNGPQMSNGMGNMMGGNQQQNNAPMQGQQMMGGMNEPMAANEAGGLFGSTW